MKSELAVSNEEHALKFANRLTVRDDFANTRQFINLNMTYALRGEDWWRRNGHPNVTLDLALILAMIGSFTTWLAMRNTAASNNHQSGPGKKA